MLYYIIKCKHKKEIIQAESAVQARLLFRHGTRSEIIRVEFATLDDINKARCVHCKTAGGVR